MIGGFLLQVKPHFGLRGGSGSKQVGVVDLPIIGKGQLAAAANKSTNFIHSLQKRTR